ncbi:DUF3459 domain-containing protein [Sphingomonas sp. MMS24-JH45]
MPWTAEGPYLGFGAAKPWLPVGEAHRALSVARQEADAGSLLAWTREILAFRKAHPALRHGDLLLGEPAGDLLLFERREGNERLRCAFNLGDAPAAFDAGDDVLMQQGYDAGTLAPWGGVVCR